MPFHDDDCLEAFRQTSGLFRHGKRFRLRNEGLDESVQFSGVGRQYQWTFPLPTEFWVGGKDIQGIRIQYQRLFLVQEKRKDFTEPEIQMMLYIL